MPRILAPRVHVEVFRPITKHKITLDDNSQIAQKINPHATPTKLKYIRVTPIKDRRIKGIQFEETALFGGFIEINIAEDPQSELFDNFLPNDHVEVFYNDILSKAVEDESWFPHTNLNLDEDYKFTAGLPKFQGASWKTDLKYRPTMVTTQLHAWDYLRIMQYINIPKGERKGKNRALRVDEIKDKKSGDVRLKTTQQRQKYGDDMLDYIDGAVTAFVNNRDVSSIFGQHRLTPETANSNVVAGAAPAKSLVFSKTTQTAPGTKPIINYYKAGVGAHVHAALDASEMYTNFRDVPNWRAPAYQVDSNGNEINPYTYQNAITDIENAMKEMQRYDIMQFRLVDGEFSRFMSISEPTGVGQPYTVDIEPLGHHVIDIIAISQFALIELLIKKLTTDHSLNQWFTPILRFDPNFIDEVELMGKQVGKGISKLIYCRFRTMRPGASVSETTTFAFNMDTYAFVQQYVTEAVKLSIGNITSTLNNLQSKAVPDIFAEMFATLDFPQRPLVADPVTGEIPTTYNIRSLSEATRAAAKPTKILTHRDVFNDLHNRFTNNFQETDTFANDGFPFMYNAIHTRLTAYASVIQKTLFQDDKMISFIRGVPASFMRADIYTGSKFNTIQYDSLAVTRIIQLIASNMAGFPATNNPKSNINTDVKQKTEKGTIDSYPIFAANRIVIRPRVFFGRLEGTRNTVDQKYELFASLSEMMGKADEINAHCFLFLDVGKKKLKKGKSKKTDTNRSSSTFGQRIIDEDSEAEAPDFIFPMEDIQDFGMIKASTVNHNFTFSLIDHWKDFSLFNSQPEDADHKTIYQNVTENGIFIDYREGGLLQAGFSPPENQHLKLEDLTQNSAYDSWKPRFMQSVNVQSTNSSLPIYNPRTAYENKQKAATPPANIFPNVYLINDYDAYGLDTDVLPIEVVMEDDFYKTNPATGGKASNEKVKDQGHTIEPFPGVTSYIDITDLKNEYRALKTIFESEFSSYRDIANVDLDLMDNIKIRAPLKFVFNKAEPKYENKITLESPPQTQPPAQRSTGQFYRPATFEEDSLSNVIKAIDTELTKITEIDMAWLFPFGGHYVDRDNKIRTAEIGSDKVLSATWNKHLFLITYLDLLIKGVRYLLWSMAKARFFAHVYLPMEHKAYAQKSPGQINYSTDVVEPGSSVQISYDDKNTLYTSTKKPLVSFPTMGMGTEGIDEGGKEKTPFMPLYRTVNRGIDKEGDIIFNGRQMTWYVSKKVTYIGADVGAMMRVEMTEGSLDWTLFYNEKNLLTQVSEHYLLNGLGNFRTGPVQ